VKHRIFAALLVALGAVPTLAAQQQPAAQPPQAPPLEIGVMAPDFALPGATRYGTLKEPVRLSDFRGKTVVLAFFYRSRTRG
jgi:cytochrome oxidase Cu insertion factor (SCO1/SenC/PrrC family)